MALNAAQEAKKNWDDKGMRALIGNEAYEKLGTYEENTGGGTPLKEGERLESKDNVYIASSQEDADEFRRKNPGFEENGGVIRHEQPRNADGTFGYNSQNKKSLKYKSRGTTIPDFLVEYVAKWYKEGKGNDDLITSQDEEYLLAFDMTMEELVKSCRSYIDEGYTGRFEALAGKGDIIEADTQDKAKAKENAQKKREAVLANRKNKAGEQGIEKEDYENAPYGNKDALADYIRKRPELGGKFRRMRKDEPVAKPAAKPQEPVKTQATPQPTVDTKPQGKKGIDYGRLGKRLGISAEEAERAHKEKRIDIDKASGKMSLRPAEKKEEPASKPKSFSDADRNDALRNINDKRLRAQKNPITIKEINRLIDEDRLEYKDGEYKVKAKKK